MTKHPQTRAERRKLATNYANKSHVHTNETKKHKISKWKIEEEEQKDAIYQFLENS